MSETNSITPDLFDKRIADLHGIPDVLQTQPRVIRDVPVYGMSESWSIQTFRQKEFGDTIFLERTNKDGTVRIAIPPSVSAAIHRQYDQLSARSRSKAAKSRAQAMKEAGILPGFMRKGRAAK
jgi:hypothetical protein